MARAAAKGKLHVEVEQMEPMENRKDQGVRTPREDASLSPEIQAKLDAVTREARRERRRKLLLLLGVLGFLLGGAVALVVFLFPG